jgi:hypothetical protein
MNSLNRYSKASLEQNNFPTKQYDRETEGWKKILGLLQQENIVQKNKLAEILKNNTRHDGQLLEKAEQYQSRFLQQDEAFRLMFNDIGEYERLEEGISSWDKAELRKINKTRNKLKKETKNLEINFTKLRSEFNNFLG